MNKTLSALRGCIDAFSKLCEVVGPGWTIALTLLVFAIIGTVLWWRGHRADQAWLRVIAAKDEMITQLNEQNRELRVQALVVGRLFTKQEAVKLVYGDGAPKLDNKAEEAKESGVAQ